MLTINSLFISHSFPAHRGGVMSGETTPQAESGSPQTTAEAPQPKKKPRSPAERVLVWGGIIVLLLLVGVQAHARKGYEWTLANLEPLIDDDKVDGQPLALADVDSHIVGFPSQSETSVDRTTTKRVYRWYGLGGSYGITISYNPGIEPVVVTGLETDDPPPPPEPQQVDESEGDVPEEPMATVGGGGGFVPMHDADGSGGGGPGGGGPGGGGGGRFNPMDNDANGDDLLSPDEVPERWRENFAERDTNGDGFIDESEIEAMRERFRQRREAGGEGDGGRPQRPAREGADQPEAPPAGESDAEATSDESAPASDEPEPGADEEPAAETP
jgi:hypothetical protein